LIIGIELVKDGKTKKKVVEGVDLLSSVVKK